MRGQPGCTWLPAFHCLWKRFRVRPPGSLARCSVMQGCFSASLFEFVCGISCLVMAASTCLLNCAPIPCLHYVGVIQRFWLWYDHSYPTWPYVCTWGHLSRDIFKNADIFGPEKLCKLWHTDDTWMRKKRWGCTQRTLHVVLEIGALTSVTTACCIIVIIIIIITLLYYYIIIL